MSWSQWVHDLHIQIATELRTEHCKTYVEPTLKKAIQDYATREDISFSEAGRRLWIRALTGTESLYDYEEPRTH
jgi:hypothetical protein